MDSGLPLVSSIADDLADSSSSPIDLNIQLAAASTSLWGFVTSAASTIKKTTSNVVTQAKKDLKEFSQQLSEENAELLAPSASPSPTHAPPSASSTPIPTQIQTSQAASLLSSPSPSSSVLSASSLSSSSSTSPSGDPSSIGSSTITTAADDSSSNNGPSSSTHQDWSTKMIDGVERLGDGVLNTAIGLLPSALWSFGGVEDETNEAQQQQQQSSSSTNGSSLSIVSTSTPNSLSSTSNLFTPASLKQNKLHQMESSIESYLTDPIATTTTTTTTTTTNTPTSIRNQEFDAFRTHFHTDYETMWREELEKTIIPNVSHTVRDMFHALVRRDDESIDPPATFGGVPINRISSNDFWCRYLYRVRLIEEEESRRLALLGKLAAGVNDGNGSTSASAANGAATNMAQEDSWDDELPVTDETETKQTNEGEEEANVKVDQHHSPPPSSHPSSVEPPTQSVSSSEPASPSSAADGDVDVVAPPSHSTPSPPVCVDAPAESTTITRTPSPELSTNVTPIQSTTPDTTITPATTTIALALTDAPIETATAPAPTALKPAQETKEQMRARLQAEAKERVAKKLAESKAAKAAAALAAVNSSTAPSSSSSSSSSSIPPPHPLPSSTGDQVTILSSTFSQTITASVPTNTTPEPLRRKLAAQAVAEATTAHAAAAAAAAAAQPTPVTSDLSSPSPLSSSRSSSQTSSVGWEDISDSTTIHHAATAAKSLHNTNTTVTATKNNNDTNATASASADDWSDWE